MKKQLLAFTVALACLSTARTQTKDDISISFGKFNCGQWSEGDNSLIKLWLVGFLGGLNVGARTTLAKPGPDPLRHLGQANQVFLWMDNYCKANPLNTVREGAQAIYDELKNK